MSVLPWWLDDAPKKKAVIPWYRAGGAPAPLAAYQPKGAASYAASKVNLVTPGTYDLTETGAVTWNTATGWSYNGSHSHSTGITPVAGYTMIIQFSGFTQSTNGIMGEYTAPSARLEIWPFYTAPNAVFYSNGGTAIIAPGIAAANLAVAGQQGYRNGVADGAAVPAWSGVATSAIGIGRVNGVGAICTATVTSAAIYATALTPVQVAAVAAAMAAL